MISSLPPAPNILIVFTDQQRWDTVGCYGNPMGLTPHLDAMARQGVRFEYAFTPQPVCAPARGCLQTGRYATAHGVWRNGLALSADEATLAHDFGSAGYRTGYIGKWHLANTGAEAVPPERRGGYQHWEAADVLEYTSHPYDTVLFDVANQPIHLAGYRVDALTDRAVAFLRQPQERPFFLFLSFLEPHFQNDLQAFVAPDGYAERYADCYVPPDLEGHPGDWPESLPDYYGMVARIDECLGRLRAELERQGLDRNTLVVFTSDHGCHFRTRNGEYKRSCHESSIRIPLLMQGPGFEGGRVISELVSLLDLPPTLLAAAGLEVPARMQGHSLWPLVQGEATDWPAEVFFQISESQVGRALRTARWKYSVEAPEKQGWRDPASDTYVEQYLYDLDADPFEQRNLVGQPAYRQVAEELRQLLRDRMVAAGEAAPEIRTVPEGGL